MKEDFMPSMLPEGVLGVKHTHLSYALREGEVQPFDPKRVTAYMRDMLEANPPSIWWEVGQKPAAQIILSLIPIAGAALVFLGGGGMALAFVTEAIPEMIGTSLPAAAGEINTSLWNGSFFVALAGIAVFLVGVLAIHASGKIMVRGPAEWTQHPLDAYERAGRRIPDAAMDKVRRIRQLFPGAKFIVEELRQGKEPLDPLLIVEDPGTSPPERYFIHQWDEPLFTDT